MTISNDLKDRLLLNTGFFEGNDDFSTVAGNFDEQGVSFGIIQFNFEQGSLAPLLKDYINNYPSEFDTVFGTKADTLRDVVFNRTESQ